ncbi:hypothetical protein C813_16760 [Kosakonia sacchari SP1]|nr:hypothetical protein C813_16760 [Kosakonia sacchari SP1]
MTERHDSHRGTVQRFSYDDEHRISQVIIEGDAEFTRAEYRYDALGRRTEKQVWRRHTRNAERTQYAWSGLQMVGECSDSNPDAAVQYIYTENSYEPLARVDSRGEHAEVYWYHTELNGLPEKVTDSSGDIVWQGVSTTWGRSERENSNADWDVPQNLRFQGQYLDRETGLHYNTFRYYDPCGGRYTQMDPIGLLGGLNTYTYVVDPLVWVDPLGLSACAFGGYFNRKGLRRDVYRAQRPGSYHSIKHIQAKTAEEARLLSLGKGARKGDPEASYFPEFAKQVTGFEKQAAYDAIRNGNVFEHGGTRFMFYKNPTGPVGYNAGKMTDWVRIEMTNTGVPVIHSFPASIEQVGKYIPGAK